MNFILNEGDQRFEFNENDFRIDWIKDEYANGYIFDGHFDLPAQSESQFYSVFLEDENEVTDSFKSELVGKCADCNADVEISAAADAMILKCQACILTHSVVTPSDDNTQLKLNYSLPSKKINVKTRNDTKCNVKRNQANSVENAYQCRYCDEYCSSIKLLLRHIKVHTRVNCKYCNKYFSNTTELDIHLKIHETRVSNTVECVSKPKRNITKEPFNCGYCRKRFSTYGLLQKHYLYHKNSQVIQCAVCSNKFNNKVMLKQHILSHHNSVKSKTDCNKVHSDNTYSKIDYNTYLELQKHNLRHNCLLLADNTNNSQDIYIFQCSQCNEWFCDKTVLDRFQLCQSNNFTCKYCGYKFNNNSAWSVHVSSHLNEKLFQCKYCDLRFTYSSMLLRHVRECHKSS